MFLGGVAFALCFFAGQNRHHGRVQRSEELPSEHGWDDQ